MVDRWSATRVGGGAGVTTAGVRVCGTGVALMEGWNQEPCKGEKRQHDGRKLRGCEYDKDDEGYGDDDEDEAYGIYVASRHASRDTRIRGGSQPSDSCAEIASHSWKTVATFSMRAPAPNSH